ncbi:MAG: 23S rRNA (guanosine(2251)-2'-O)-methyltransferase RlmB [Acidobacteriota bacterium]|nr:MAG: 23S rRNA (guanosine(2251)-2'-O)-methyltransferase RlmB [Acidobacteriota bacterium]
MNLVYGVHAVREALRATPQRVRKLVLAEGALDARKRELMALAREHGIPVYREARDRIGRQNRQNQQGVAAELAAFEWTDLDAMLAEAPTPAFFLVLDQVEDPRNFGAVVRAADGAGVHGIVVPERKTAPPSDVAIVASAGALHHARIARVRNLSDTLTSLKESGVWTVGLSPDAKDPWPSFDYTEPVAIVLGSEGKGLRTRVAATCDTLVSIPQMGQVESLNLSVAAGIVLYEVVRQRSGQHTGRPPATSR